jgi:hypothetical protein
MSDGLTLEKMKVGERLASMETSVNTLNDSVQEIRIVLFGEKGEKGVVSQLKEMVALGEKIEKTVWGGVKLIVGSILLAALPSMAEYLNQIFHHVK